MKSGRADELAMHPPVKPVLLVADAIKDVSKRKGIVLDPFWRVGHHHHRGGEDRPSRPRH